MICIIYNNLYKLLKDKGWDYEALKGFKFKENR